MVKVKKLQNFRASVIRLAVIHFFYILAFAVSVIVYDASQLISPDAVLYRWKLAAAMTALTTAVWYAARTSKDKPNIHKLLVGVLVLADILFASLLIYNDRGMASLAVALYAVPITTATVLLSRSAVLATASLCTAAYALVSVKYFVDFFNEGYKVQLYSSIGFYGATFFVLALILITVVRKKTN